MQGDLNKEIKRLSGLKQNKNKSNAYLEHEARLNIWKRQINITEKFFNNDDKELAKKLFDDYVDNYSFDNFSDLNTLADLVFEEVLKDGLQRQIQKITSDESNNFFPEKTIKSLQEIETRVLDLKQKLGINKEETQDDLTRLQKLEKKFKKHYLLNRNEYSMVCPSCSKMTLLRRRTKDFDVLIHPFFSGRFYYNRRGMELVKQGIWTKEQYAWVFFTSVDYVNWCIEHEAEIPDLDELEGESFEDFISKIPYLKKPKIPENIKNETETK